MKKYVILMGMIMLMSLVSGYTIFNEDCNSLSEWETGGFVATGGNCESLSPSPSIEYMSLTDDIDTTGNASLTLSFDWDQQGAETMGYEAHISSNGGSSWTRVWRWTSGASGSESIDVSGFISANTNMNFTCTTGSPPDVNDYCGFDNILLEGTSTYCDGSSTCEIPCGDSVSVEEDAGGNPILFTGTGLSIISADLVDWDYIYVPNGCTIYLEGGVKLRP